jgi:hypothetical protein
MLTHLNSFTDEVSNIGMYLEESVDSNYTDPSSAPGSSSGVDAFGINDIDDEDDVSPTTTHIYIIFNYRWPYQPKFCA